MPVIISSVPSGITSNQEDPEDILSASLTTLYDYIPVTYSDAGATINYVYPEVEHTDIESGDGKAIRENPIQLKLFTPDTHARNWELHASSIWAAAVFLADHISELRIEEIFSPELRNESHIVDVLELGAGAGLPGLLLSKHLGNIRKGKNDWRVTLSDYPDDLLIDNLKRNVQENYVDDVGTNQSNNVLVTPYAWGSSIDVFATSGAQGFDIILAADTLWNPSLHHMFSQTLFRLLRRTESSRIHLIAGLHTGRYTINRFLQTISKVTSDTKETSGGSVDLAKLRVLRITEMEVETGQKREWKVDREEEDYADRRRWLAWITIAWEGI